MIRIPIEKGRATGVYQDFLTGFTTNGIAWGRPVGVAVAADGSTISGTYEGTYTVLDNGQIQFDVRVLWLEGTGRLEGVTGEADTVAILDGLAAGAAFTYDTEGTLTFP